MMSIADTESRSRSCFLVQIGSLHFIIALVAGWLQREQGAVLEYLKEENRVLRE